MNRHSNIFPVIYFLKNFATVTPFLSLYFSKWASIEEIALLFGLYSITIVIFEFPTGVISDRIGSKKAIIVGVFIIFLASLLMAHGGFYAIVFAQVFLGLGHTFLSGSIESLMMNSIEQEKRDIEYRDISNVCWQFSWIAVAIAPIVGYLVSLFEIRYVFFVNVVVNMLFLFVTLYLPRDTTKSLSQTWLIIKEVRIYLARTKSLYYPIILSTVVSSVFITIYVLFQVFLREREIDGAHNGLIYSLVAVFGFIGTTAYKKTKGHTVNIFLSTGIVLFITMIVVFGFTISHNIWIAATLFLIFRAIWGYISPQVGQNLNLSIQNDKLRNSMLSFTSLLSSLLHSILVYFLPKISGSATNSFYGISALLICFSLLFLVKYFSMTESEDNPPE